MRDFRWNRPRLRPRIPAALLVALAALVPLAGCATGRIPFTQTLREQYGLEREDLKNLQYYIAGDITLQRDFRREEGGISKSHKLVMKEGGLVEEVFIPDGTPGVVAEAGETYIAVRFGPGGTLNFGSTASDRDPDRRYKLLAKRWTPEYGELAYEDKLYYAVDGSSWAYLEVGTESLDAVRRERKVLPGMTLPPK